LKRIIIIIAAAAMVALGVGVTVGSTHQGSRPTPATQTAAPQDAQTPDQQLCEQAAQQRRAKHPHVYIGGCNHGASTLPTP
jgi:uncharacterized alpha/beta hydrolase family protein